MENQQGSSVSLLPGLPDEMLEQVFLYLPVDANKVLRICCKAFNYIIDGSLRHIELDMQDPLCLGQLKHGSFKLDGLLKLFSRLSFLRSASCLGVSSATAKRLAAILPGLPHLSSLNICFHSEDAGLLNCLPVCSLQNLTALTLLSSKQSGQPIDLNCLPVCSELQSLCIDSQMLTAQPPQDVSKVAATTEAHSDSPLAALSHLAKLSTLLLVDSSSSEKTRCCAAHTPTVPIGKNSPIQGLTLPPLLHVTQLTAPSTPGIVSTLCNCSSLQNLHLLSTPTPPSSTQHRWAPKSPLRELTALRAPSKLLPTLHSASPSLRSLTLDMNDGGSIRRIDIRHLATVTSLSLQAEVLNSRVLASVLHLQTLPSLKALTLEFTKMLDPRALSVIKVHDHLHDLHLRVPSQTHFTPPKPACDHAHLRFVAAAFEDWEAYKDDMMRHFEGDMMLAALGVAGDHAPHMKIWVHSGAHDIAVSKDCYDPVLKCMIADVAPNLEEKVALML